MLRSTVQVMILVGLVGLSLGWFSFPSKLPPGLHCSEPNWRLGVLRANEARSPHKHRFALNNTSESELKLVVRSLCGCLVPDFPESILAGEIKEMEVVFNPPPVPGPFEKRVDVNRSGDGSVSGVTTLRALGQVAAESFFHAIPKSVHFGTVRVSETSERDLYLCSYTGQAIGTAKLVDKMGQVVSLNAEEVPEMERVRLRLQFSPGESSGYVRGVFELFVEKQGSVWVPYEAIVVP